MFIIFLINFIYTYKKVVIYINKMENTNIIKEKLQQNALVKFIEHYYKKKENRGIFCACCGYGKSYLIYKIIKECIERGDKIFIIATSRIKLVEQLGPDVYKWNKNEKNINKLQINILCSDNIYETKEKYSKKLNITEDEIITRIKSKKINIFITTYQSATKIVEKISDFNKNLENSEEYIEPDLIILDEAHNTVGTSKDKKEKFHHELFKTNEFFSSAKYLFMTATPVKMIHKNPNSEINTEETIYSMTNRKIYGDIFYYYSFSKGIEDKIITNFKTIFLANGKIPDDIKDKINDLTKEEKEKQYFNEISSLLIQSMVKYRFKKTIVYISNKNKAEILKNILIKICDKIKIDGNKIKIYKIVDNMKNQDKKEEQNKFIKNEYSILISVNIFNEGVDIPCVDSVMFAEERYTQTTIVQNIGRCLRIDNDNNNKIGYVILPNVIYEIGDDDNNNNFYSSKFKIIRNCINIIKNNKSNYLFKKFTNNKKNKNINDSDEENDDSSIEDLNEEIIKEDNNIEKVDNNILYNLDLLKYFEIHGTFDGFISNITLEEIREKYIVKKKITNIKDYGKNIKNDKNDHFLRLDEDYKNEWISWDYFINLKKSPSYDEAKKLLLKLKDENIYIKNINTYFEIYKYFLGKEFDEDFNNEYNNEINIIFFNIDKIYRINKNKYYEILNIILQIPFQPEKYYNSTKEWISIEDFLSISLNSYSNNKSSNLLLEETNEINNYKNITNLLNNDNIKVKKNKWNQIKIDIPNILIEYLINNNLYEKSKFNLVVEYRLNKNDIYDSSNILIQDKINNITLGRILLDENKIEYNENFIIFSNQEIIDNKLNKLNGFRYFDKVIKDSIDILIDDIKNIVNNNLEYKLLPENCINGELINYLIRNNLYDKQNNKLELRCKNNQIDKAEISIKNFENKEIILVDLYDKTIKYNDIIKEIDSDYKHACNATIGNIRRNIIKIF